MMALVVTLMKKMVRHLVVVVQAGEHIGTMIHQLKTAIVELLVVIEIASDEIPGTDAQVVPITTKRNQDAALLLLAKKRLVDLEAEEPVIDETNVILKKKIVTESVNERKSENEILAEVERLIDTKIREGHGILVIVMLIEITVIAETEIVMVIDGMVLVVVIVLLNEALLLTERRPLLDPPVVLLARSLELCPPTLQTCVDF